MRFHIVVNKQAKERGKMKLFHIFLLYGLFALTTSSKRLVSSRRISQFETIDIPKSTTDRNQRVMKSTIIGGLLTSIMVCRPKSSTALTSDNTVMGTAFASDNAAMRELSEVVTASAEAESFVSGLVSGAVTRAAKEIILHPIDTIRARQQTILKTDVSSNVSTVNSTVSPFDTFKELYTGVVPALVGGIPAGILL